jgi:hypothetical protein
MKKVLFIGCLLAAGAAGACDICSLYTAQYAMTGVLPGWDIGLFEQAAHFSTLRQNGDKIAGEGAKMDSFTTQAVLGYRFDSAWRVQLNAPFIYRSYERPDLEGGAIRSGSESGLGDLSLTAAARIFHAEREKNLIAINVLGGVKMPTGDSGRLRETPEPDMGEEHVLHGGLHDHDLALGSGSWDGLLGASLCGFADRWFMRAQTQYALRTEGAHGYRYANDLTWSVQPGYTVWRTHQATVGLGLGLNGEHKDEDKRDGEADDDTAMDAVYAGPLLTYTGGTSLCGELALDLPVQQDNSGAQLVPDFRVRAALTKRF